jgi:hypothetical protein
VVRLLKAYRTEGRVGLISKRRSRSGNRRKPEVGSHQGAVDRPNFGGREAARSA